MGHQTNFLNCGEPDFGSGADCETRTRDPVITNDKVHSLSNRLEIWQCMKMDTTARSHSHFFCGEIPVLLLA
jgi:hypothetical protein